MADKHKEAFALMWYGCACGHRERIWNSRDGVTPFGTLCPSCGQHTLTHTDWNRDERQPDHKLVKGQRYWRDGTADDAVAIIKRRLQRSAEQGAPASEDVAERLLDNARNQQGEWLQGWPKLACCGFEEEVAHA